ncbi:unnamed protein product [Rotaria sp. Silwood1]|nr:unnamed protein product [Rotaria sp. Silwood1]
MWQQYQLVILIHLRNLTKTRYPPSHSYSPVDLVKKEYFPYDELSNEDRRRFKGYYDKGQVLWILDGYDELVQDIPEQLKDIFDHVRNTQHHIMTSRPFAIALPYDIKLEITGFTNDNIQKYVEQFFDQIKDEIDNSSLQALKLLSFLQNNPRIWGIVHIPVNLELMCSLWCDTNWSETTTLTMTTVYDKMTEWLCRRHLEKRNISSSQMTKEYVYKHFQQELGFLESLAFNGMESKNDLPSNDMNLLATEFDMWQHKWKKTSIAKKPSNVIDSLNALLSLRSFYPNLYCLFELFAILPVTVSTAERSFSTMKRIITILRNSIGDERLSNLALIHIHHDIASNLNVEDLINIFCKDKRRIKFTNK